MAKIITFSQKFPQYHPKKNEPTLFVEKILINLGIDYSSLGYLDMLLELNKKAIKEEKISVNDIKVFIKNLNQYCMIDCKDKSHTMRNGKRFKSGEYFSPRVWVGKPYHSTPLIFAPNTMIKKTFDVVIYETNEVFINKKFFCSYASRNFGTLAKNDGLTPQDMKDWFSKLPFEGQIISWNRNVNY